MRIFLLSAFLACALTTVSVNASFAQKKQKQYVAKVYMLDKKVIRGTLRSAEDKGLYLAGRMGDTLTFVNASQIKTIKLRRKSKSSTGATIGFLSGLALGGGAVAALYGDDKLNNTIYTVGAVMFTFTTTAIAGAISSRPDEVIKINGRTDDYLQKLKLLQSMAPQQPHH